MVAVGNKLFKLNRIGTPLYMGSSCVTGHGRSALIGASCANFTVQLLHKGAHVEPKGLALIAQCFPYHAPDSPDYSKRCPSKPMLPTSNCLLPLPKLYFLLSVADLQCICRLSSLFRNSQNHCLVSHCFVVSFGLLVL